MQTRNTDSLAYYDSGDGPSVLFVHGTPTNGSEYRRTIAHLDRRFRCVAPDHLGFGESPKPREGDYSLPAHQRRLRALIAHLGLRSFHLVVHDFGGVIGLPLALDLNLDVRSVTILNSWIWPLVETEPQMRFQRPLLRAGVLPWLYRYANFSPKVLLKMAWGEKASLSRATHCRYIDQFPTPNDRSGTVGFLRALFDFDEPSWQLHRRLREFTAPTQIVWGCADKLISLRTLERWRVELPEARVTTLDTVGHFVAEEAPDELATHLAAFLDAVESGG